MTDEQLATVFSALGDEHRVRALRFIACCGSPVKAATDEHTCACHVQEHLDLSQPATSYHMRVLQEADLVTAEKRGRWVHYSISERGLSIVRSFLSELGEKAPGTVTAGV